jgi:hypothetical protein
MNDDAPVLDLSSFARLGSFLLFTAGIASVFAGGQVWWAVIFREAWQGWLPILQMAAGLAAALLAIHLNHPRRWALFVAFPLLTGLGCAGVPWAIWLMFNGVFTALTVFAPGWAFLAFLVLLATTGELLRVSRARAVADAETARLTLEATQSGYGYARGGPRGGGWLLPALLSVMAIPVAGFVTAVGWPDTWALISFRIMGVVAGRNPFGESFVEAATDYPYTGSPIAWYLETEAAFVPVADVQVLGFMDKVADDVAWALAGETGEGDPTAAETALWAAGRQRELPAWIADSLRRRGVFYSPESLLSRSFDPAIHSTPDAVHLDCDQLVYAFAHVAWRLDLAMKPIPAPYHMYLRYDGPDGQPPIFVETTEFRNVLVTEYRVDYLGEKLGDDFIIEGDYFSSGRGGTWASERIREAAGLYEPMTERDIRDSILANVLVGVARSGKVQPYPEASEARLEGTRSLELVSNLYGWYVGVAKEKLASGELAEARAAATRAREIRASHGPLLIRSTTPEEDVLDTVALMEADAEGEAEADAEAMATGGE